MVGTGGRPPRAIAGECNLVKLKSVMVAAMGSCVAVRAAVIKVMTPPFSVRIQYQSYNKRNPRFGHLGRD